MKLLQISDLHVERITGREERLVDLVKQLEPDVIALTGDYLNISYSYDPLAQNHARSLLGQLSAPHGVYAISGSRSVDPPRVVADLFRGMPVEWLRDKALEIDVNGSSVLLVGLDCTDDREADASRLARLLNVAENDAFLLLLYHMPDLMPSAVSLGVDLYLAGHTHGGQLRLPLFGALATASRFGKKYEMGLYVEERTRLYVSRGVGFEGAGAPRARFLCPPEIVLFTLAGNEE